MNNRQLIRYSIMGLVFFVGLFVFFSIKSYPADHNKNIVISNDYVLRDSVPQQVYAYTLTKVSRWRASHAPTVDLYKISGDITTDNEGYNFTLKSDGQETETYVHVAVKNYGNFFSIAVSINGQTQGI